MESSIMARRGISTAMGAVVLTLALVLASTAGLDRAAAADWPSFRGGPTQNMSSPEDPGIHPEQAWEGLESMREEPCVIATGNSVFTVATPRTDFGQQRLFRIDLESGKTIWSTSPFEVAQASACPAADDSHVYYVHQNLLTARDISSGEQIWEVSVGGTAEKPMLAAGTVYVVALKTLFALDAETGKTRWTASVGSSNRPPLVVGDVVVNFSYESGLTAFDATTGAFLWNDASRPNDAIGVGTSVVYTGESNKTIISRDASTGAISWTYGVPPLTTAQKLVADEGIVYALVPTSDYRFQFNHLVALDGESGSPLYSREYEPTTSYGGTTSAYPPFVKFGSRLYNQYRYFDAETGDSPGGPTARTQTLFYDPEGCANEKDGMFAHTGELVVLWKNLCNRSVLVAKRSPAPEPTVVPELIEPAPEAMTDAWPRFGWEVGSYTGITRFQVVVDGSVAMEVRANDQSKYFAILKSELPDGLHTWSISSIYTSGESVASETRSFTVDSSPPAPFELLEPADGAVTSPRPTFAWEAAEDAGSGIDHYELLVNGEMLAALPPGTESFSPSFDLPDGVHSWTVAACDAIGNVREAEPRKFIIDRSEPQGIELIEPRNGKLTGPRPLFRWYAASDSVGMDHYELFVDGTQLAKIPADSEEVVSFAPEEDLSDGQHTWLVRAYDSAGNFQQSTTEGFVVDGSPPASFALLSPADGVTTYQRPEFDWDPAGDAGSGLSHYELIVDGKMLVVKEDQYVLPYDLADGDHTWSVTAVDRIGNRTESETRAFSVDGSPPAPFELLEPANGAVTDARPRFGWEAAADVGPAGLDHYELCIDEGIRINLPPGTESYVPSEDLAAGGHAWWVEAVDGGNHHRVTESRGFIVASPPKAVLPPSPLLALTGVPLTIDASASNPPPAGEITGHRWDLDGNGSFETDTGTTPTASHVYSQVGDLTVSVRVLSNLGTEATASTTVSVRPVPPAGPLGVTINNGAQFTNSPNVTLSVVWPSYAATALLSNDGGFRAAASIPLAAAVPWTLESSGSERLPKTVYVRFEGGSAGRETYQDDIILDQQKPKVGKAALVEGTTLELSASDRTSGVTAMQIATARSAGSWRPFTRIVEFSHRRWGLKVRVRDRAGNFSPWRLVRMPGQKRRGR
jgi:outer membrane protein assembly factor BamB